VTLNLTLKAFATRICNSSFKKFDLTYKFAFKVKFKVTNFSPTLKIIQLSFLVFFEENTSFSSYQRGKIKMAYSVYEPGNFLRFLYFEEIF